MRKIMLFSLLIGALTGAGIAAASPGAFLNGWLAAGALSAAVLFGLGLAWRWAGGGRRLLILMAVSFGLRLVIGMGMSLGLQAFGYDEPVQRSGYVYADAYSRDQDAWTLATSKEPIWASFRQQFLSDQYGGSLSLSALVYRVLSPDAHRPFLILILTAFAFTLGLPFVWKAVAARWNEPLALLTGWLLVLYPESVLVGASQMREPFLLGLTMISFWAVFAWRNQPRRALAVFLAAGLLMLAFSSRAAIVVIAALLVCAWVEYFDQIATQRWKWLGWAVVALGGVIFVALSWSWLKLATSYDAGLSIRQSGMVQRILAPLAEDFRVPFVTVYGLFQPVLPAVLVDPAAAIWKTIGILRAAGWYLLAPFLLYAGFTSLRATSAKDRRMLAWFGLSALLWILLSSARAGGDQWDNPRYRVLFLPFMALLTAWGWRWSREHKDAWIWAWAGADFVFFTFFLSWYLSRVTGAFGKLPFWLMVALILGLSAAVLLAGWLWNMRRQGKSIRAELASLWLKLKGFISLRPESAVASPVVAASSGRRVNRWDGLVTLAFLGFALLFFLGRLQGNFPILILGGDAGTIVSFAAAQAQPELFRGDPALGEANLTGYYATLQIPIIKALAPLAGGNYAWGFTWLVVPHVFLQLLGFYLLGRVLFRSRFWGALLAILTAMPFLDVGLGEFWGIWRDTLPRVTFQTVLPYLLVLVILWRNQPKRWPWLMILSGLMVFLHSVSTPAIGAGIWLSLWLYHPREWKWPRRVGVMLGLGLLFLLAITPFAVNFLTYQNRGASVAVDAGQIVQLINTYGPLNILNVPAAFGSFLWEATRSLLLPLAVIGLFVLWRFGRADRRLVGMVLLWAGGIFVATVLVPFGERLVEKALHIPPVDTELMRGMRYFVPLLLLFWLWPLAELAPRFASRQATRFALLLGILLVGGWTVTHFPDRRRVYEAAVCLARVHLVCEGEERDSAGLITALRAQTPPGAKIFSFNVEDTSTSKSLSIRYDALRPMVYTQRDFGLFVFANRAALPSWLEITRQVDTIQAMTSPEDRLAELVPLARRLNADYLTVDFPIAQTDLARLPGDLVWQNKQYALIKLAARP